MIRTATLEDSPAIVRLATQFLATSSYGRLFPVDTGRLERLVPFILEHGIIFVAEATFFPSPVLEGSREVIGFLAAVEATDPYSGQRYADEIAWFVAPAASSRTAGPRLLRALETWSADKKLSFVKMVAPAASRSDVAGFYLRHGYAALETSFVKRLG